MFYHTCVNQRIDLNAGYEGCSIPPQTTKRLDNSFNHVSIVARVIFVREKNTWQLLPDLKINIHNSFQQRNDILSKDKERKTSHTQFIRARPTP